MNEDRKLTESKLIDAAIECIEAHGLSGATIQRIAERAGVNNAAVNYYFRSKDQLIHRALTVTLANAFDWGDFAESENLPAAERLVHILTTLMRDAHQYPGLSLAHFSETITQRNYDTVAIHRLNAFIGELEADLTKRGVSLTGDELKMALTQIVGCVLLQGILLPGLFTEYSGMDLGVDKVAERFVRRLVERLL
jgi:AcrR family transcriptional regulator